MIASAILVASTQPLLRRREPLLPNGRDRKLGGTPGSAQPWSRHHPGSTVPDYLIASDPHIRRDRSLAPPTP